MAAQTLAEAGRSVVLYESKPTFGLKFLLAGRSGLNLTHAEPLEDFVTRYEGSMGRTLADELLPEFGPEELREWAHTLGVRTFEGSTKRVFPEEMRATPLLRAWLRRLDALGVDMRSRHRWLGFSAEGIRVRDEQSGAVREVLPQAVVLALGGASWPRMGSDGAWTGVLAEAGAEVAPLRAANASVPVSWSDAFIERFAGAPLKNVAIRFDGRVSRGDANVSESGLEGGAVYPLAASVRDSLEVDKGEAVLELDLKPDVTTEALIQRLSQSALNRRSFSERLRRATRLKPVAVNLLRECAKEAPALEPAALASLVKACPVAVAQAPALDKAVSSAGGVARSAFSPELPLMLEKQPGCFVAGEMIDWTAPCGGYLLTMSMSTGRAAAQQAERWLQAQHSETCQ